MTFKSSFLRRSVRGLVPLILALTAATAALFPANTLSQATPSRVVLAPGNPQAFATALDAGLMPSSQRVSLMLTLTPDPARAGALDQYLAALVTPSSPSYHQWLSPAQFADSYGATPAQLAAVTSWAQSAGLTVDALSPGANRISVSGPAARVQSAFATSLHLYQINAAVFYANATRPSLPVAAAQLFVAVEGLDNLPASSVLHAPGTAGDFNSLAALVDANSTAILPLTGTATLSAAQLPEYTQLFRQAAAQGMTTLLPTAAGTFADAVALADTTTQAATALERPAWQSAPGLPADGFRDTPDLSAASLTALAQTLTTIAGPGRLGNIAPVLYSLGPVSGLFTQPDAAAAGTWEPATGLGLVDLTTLATAYPRGSGMSYTSFAATNYSPIHGQGTSFTSMVTSGTGGGTPAGTVAFVTSTGTTLGTVALVGGSATLSINTLAGGNYTIQAVYSGDGSYASSQSPASQIYVAPEPSQLSAAVSGSPVVGSSFSVVVMDSATYGAPTGPITLMVSGSSTNLTQTLTPSTGTSSTATFTVPSQAPGGITLSINCTTSANYSCYNPYTTTVQIGKATPVLSISYNPNPPVSGGQITLNAVVSTVGSAPAPTGNVQFFDNGTQLNAGALSGGTTTTTGTVPTTSTHNITANYNGDPNYNSVSTTASSTSSGTIATTTNLMSSSSAANSGANVTFTATITPSSTGPAGPTGTVQFFDGSTSLGTANVAGNSASLTVNTLSSSASHTINAMYSGDGYYTASTSNPVTLNPGSSSNNTTTTLTASSTTPVHGFGLRLTAMVVPPNGGTAATGTVTFSSQAGTVGTATLSNGIATLSLNSLAGGSYSFTATYGGGGTYNVSTSAPLAVNVTPEPTNLTLSYLGGATFGSPLYLVVTAAGNSGYGNPTGSVTGTPTGNGYSTPVTSSLKTPPGAVSSSGITLDFQATGAGSVILSVTYAGDASFAAAGPVSTTVNVARAASTVSFGVSPSPIISGQPATFTAKVSFIGSVAPTGTVQFLDGATVIGTGTLDATGTAAYTSTLSVGNHILSAAYSGDTDYLPGNSPSSNTTTGTAISSTLIALSPTTLTLGASDTLMATVTGTAGGAIPTGTVQFLSAGTVLCTVTLSGGSASCLYTPMAAGNYSITASFLGDANYAASGSGAATLTVPLGTGALTATVSPSTVAGNTAATVTANVTAPNGIVPSGSITAAILSSTGAVQGTYSATLPTVLGTNVDVVSIPIVSPQVSGAYTVTVSCVNTNFSCTSVSLPFTVSGAATSGTAVITAAINPATALPGSIATVSGSVTAATGTSITGTVTATITGVTGAAYTYTFPGTDVTTGAFTIPVVVPATPGLYSISTACNSTTFTCTPITLSLTSSTTALIATSTKLAATLSATATGATVFTASVTAAAAGAAVPTGTVTFYDGSTPIGIAMLGTTGTASISLTQNLIITHSYTAVYSGDTLYSPSTSAAITGTGASTPAAITLTSSTGSALSGQNVALTAQVTGLTATGAGPTGSVSFYIVGNSARLLGTVALTSNGSGSAAAVLTTTGLPSGTLTIDAVYSGDTNFAAVTSNIITLGTTDFSVTFNPPTLTIIRGGSAFTTATVSFLGGLTGAVTLGCTPPASSYITCSFSPSVVTGTGTAILNVQTAAAAHAALSSGPTLHTRLLGGASLAAFLCLLLPGRSRRRLPTLLLMLIGLGLMSGLGCSQNNFTSAPLSVAGSPLGTSILTITTAGTDGVNTIRHTYYYQVTVE